MFLKTRSVFSLAGLREEPPDEGSIRPLVSDFLEVMDLLRNLPEAAPTRSPSLALRRITPGGEVGQTNPNEANQLSESKLKETNWRESNLSTESVE